MKKFGSLEKVIEYVRKKSPTTQIDAECMFEAKDYFLTALPAIDSNPNFVLTDDNLKLRRFQYEELMDFMCVKHGFDIDRMNKAIQRLKIAYGKMGVNRPNVKKTHSIIHPRSEEYVFIDDIRRLYEEPIEQ